MDKKSILVFGAGELQKSIIERAKANNLFVVGIDPCKNACCRECVDVFEIIGGQDYDATLRIAKKYNISALITAATDKPLVMMARIAKELGLNFFSEKTAIISTDKFLMKKVFVENNIQCAKGGIINSLNADFDLNYPVIVKPLDNSGSRGVVYCANCSEFKRAFYEAKMYTNRDEVLVEEYIEGQEYSIESLHFNGKVKVLQFTEKTTTPLPYNVEIEHVQPANLSPSQKKQIEGLITAIGKAFQFENCASHTELKINKRGVFVIETSPRLGGDYITSRLVPCSTGLSIEDLMIKISLGEDITIPVPDNKYSAIKYFNLPEGKLVAINAFLEKIKELPYIKEYSFSLHEGDEVGMLKTGLDRYGYVIFEANSRDELLIALSECESLGSLLQIEQ